jgi:hypothetical protein
VARRRTAKRSRTGLTYRAGDRRSQVVRTERRLADPRVPSADPSPADCKPAGSSRPLIRNNDKDNVGMGVSTFLTSVADGSLPRARPTRQNVATVPQLRSPSCPQRRARSCPGAIRHHHSRRSTGSPEVALQLAKRWREGYDVVYAVHGHRQGESRRKVATARWSTACCRA